ncbi:hypothetical protein EG19_06865 [Thermoanaerobaculum aquaticum]|uniref:M23ase beta-sheet core domain-containing protein n=1 Tax=Thermoanaerobaculum aquaticum TaxID=1312852 RepID=A0A062XKX3_9BACT|nr:M23 family metallopeptidase [Thermoanaerobaculum aquaticum]KDA53202.1 hypothetical protein EG19_06865 [Thermoanaerobaculum aquaticum]
MVEVQFHPADVSRTARYFFLDRRQLWWGAGLAVVVLGVVVAGLWQVPRGVEAVVLWAKLQEAKRVHQQLTREREALLQKQRALEAKLSAAGRELRRLGLILGFAPAASEDLWASEDLLQGAKNLLARADELLAFAANHREMVASLPAICPLPRGSFEVSSAFGVRVSPFTGTYERHKGVDLAAPAGLPVKATGKGVVLFAGRVGPENPPWARLGNVVVIDHGEWFVTIFAHLKEVLVRPGQHVKRGDVIGAVGSTGWSTAPHLHYEVRRKVGDNKLVPTDPFFFMLDYPVTEGAKAVGGEEDTALDLLPEEEHWPWLKTKRYPR